MTTSNRKVSRYTQVAIIANIVLFILFGVRYLIIDRTGHFIGTMLIIAGIVNIILLLFNFNKKNIFFMVLNFVFAAISFIVYYDFRNTAFFNYLWLAIALYYLVSGLYLMYKLNKGKNASATAK